ncbi:hypothetical protein GCM10023350_21250 [Nocardioides endophyticus]|uniref:Bacterial CdiA-CT RNAse A domain-containing protein n=1 Tax=Nocardioides endophyticus TaxID=1353775 RepID=A0ABP8YSW3_9ACTN
MRLAVSEQGYSSAVESLVSGNKLAAQTATRLAGRLWGYGGMAGDDSTATDFATSYDDGAGASIEALESMVGAFGALGKLVEASLSNHAHADARSTLPGWARSVVGPPTVADHAVGVLLAPPPSSLGSDSGGPGGAAGLVLDVLQDVFWPSADTGRLRAAADAWTTAGVAVGLLSAHCDSALAALDGERSPEVPVAVAVIRDVRSRVVDLAAQLDALGAACSEYAEHVDTKRSELLSLLEDLARELALGAIIAGGISIVSGGAAAGAAGGLGAARLAAASSKARGILDSLRVLAGGTALGVRPVAVTAGEIGARTERINAARVMLMEASGQGVARGYQLGKLRPGWLPAHEKFGHTMERHVGRSVEYLRGRLRDQPRLKAASTFRNQKEAETAIERTLRRNEQEVLDWLKTAKDSQAFRADLGNDIGDVLVRATGEVVQAHKVKIVLLPDRSATGGWRLITAHPYL